MGTAKTTRLKKQGNNYEIEIPEELVNKLQWRSGLILEINEKNDKLIIEKLHGFMGS